MKLSDGIARGLCEEAFVPATAERLRELASECRALAVACPQESVRRDLTLTAEGFERLALAREGRELECASSAARHAEGA